MTTAGAAEPVPGRWEIIPWETRDRQRKSPVRRPQLRGGEKYLEDQERSLYIFSTYRGGTWEKLEDGKWRLMASDGQPVSSQWGYVDGKTYLLDMYGIMQTGWQMVNGKWYYLNSVGAMQTGWLLKEGKYYFLNGRRQYGCRLGQFPGDLVLF